MMLKLVKRVEAIENVVIKQTPVLEGNHVTAEKVDVVLDKFGPDACWFWTGLMNRVKIQMLT